MSMSEDIEEDTDRPCYILTFNDRHDEMFFIGPFVSAMAAWSWANEEGRNPSDNPDWHVLFVDPQQPVRVLHPSEAAIPA